MSKQRSSVGGVLTSPLNNGYSKSTVTGEIAPATDTISGKRLADYEEYQKKLATKSSTFNGLPAHKENPDYVFTWVSTDRSLSADNDGMRLLNDWAYTTQEDQPELFAAMKTDNHLIASTGNSVEKIRWKELVSMKLPKGYHDALIEYNHVIAPEQANKEFIERTVDVFDEYGVIDSTSKLASGYNPSQHKLVRVDE